MTGKVEYNLDPEKQGRIKVRIYGVNDQMEDGEYIIPTEMLPWARPGFNGSGGSVSGSGRFEIPKVGSTVMVHGGMDNPVWDGNMYISDEVVSEIGGNGYANSHILVYDTDFDNGEMKIREEHIKVFFTDKKGFVIDYKTTDGVSNITLSPNGIITISNPNGDNIILSNGTIQIKSDNEIVVDSPMVKLSDQASESVIKGDTLKEIFNNHTHTCNSGETTPPMQKLPSDILNRHVKI